MVDIDRQGAGLAGKSKMRIAILLIAGMWIVGCGACAWASAGLLRPGPSPETRLAERRDEYLAASADAIAYAEELGTPSAETWWKLPAQYEGLSDGGEVLVESLPGEAIRVHFFVARGPRGLAIVLLHCPTGDCTTAELMDRYDEVEQLDARWFVVTDY